MKACVRSIVFAVLSLAAGAWAADLDDLKKLLERPKRERPAQAPAQGGQPAPQQGGDLSGLLSSLRGISIEEEVAIGRQISGNLLGAAPLIRDHDLQAYVNRVGRWVALQSSRPDLTWTFGVIASDDVNAFAAPGGFVFVTRGLYARLRDESELAGVLGHEIGHVQQQHHLKVIQQQQLLGAGSALLAKKLTNKDAIQKLIGSGAEILARGLDKSAEFEADRIGVVLATRAGYDPWGLPAVLQGIASVSKSDGSIALLFKTHPHPDERLGQLGEAMGDRFDHISDGKALEGRLYRLPAR